MHKLPRSSFRGIKREILPIPTHVNGKTASSITFLSNSPRPQNLILLEKKYSAELESLSDDLQSKIEEYSSAKKEKDQEYFLRKKIERRMNERHGSDNGAQYVSLANRTSPLSPTAFGCD